MQLYECKKVENCFSGTNVYEYRLTVKLDENFIEGFRLNGVIRYYKNFPRPFFQVTFSDGIAIKGIIDDNVIKVNFPRASTEDQQNFEILLLEQICKVYRR